MGHYAGKETTADKVRIIEEHNHSSQNVYPSSASGITLTATTTPWLHGTITEIIPADTITEDFDIHWVDIYDLSANGEYEIILYSGGAGSEVEIGKAPANRNAVQSQEGSQPMMTRILPSGTRISASLASSTGVADTCKTKVLYHKY